MSRRRLFGWSAAVVMLVAGIVVYVLRIDQQQQPSAKRQSAGSGVPVGLISESPAESALQHVDPGEPAGKMTAPKSPSETSINRPPLADLRARILVPDAAAVRPPNAARNWEFSDYQQKTANPDAIDGETAWEAFNFARSCVGEPRTEQQFEFHLEQASEVYEANRRRMSEERFNQYVDRVQNSFLRCQEFANADVVAVAAEWLQLAADLDYLPAQIGFYQRLPRLLRETQGRVFREPHYLDMHRVKSVEYLNRALESGHHLAFSEMARALEDGVVFQPDPVAALAYLITADAIAGGNDMSILDRKTTLEDQLSLGDVRIAEQWARGLCLRYCQLIPERYESDIPVP